MDSEPKTFKESVREFKENVIEFIINPKYSNPFIWGSLIILFLYSMALTTWVYAAWVDKENRVQELESKVFRHEVRLWTVEGHNPYEPTLNITEVPRAQFDIRGRPLESPPPPPG